MSEDDDELRRLRARVAELEAKRADVAAENEIIRAGEQLRQESALALRPAILAELGAQRPALPFAPPKQIGPVKPWLRRPGGDMLRCEIGPDRTITLVYATAPPMEADTSPEAMQARIRARMPERYRTITWQNLAEKRGPEGLPILGVVIDEGGQPLQRQAAACLLYERMRKSRQVVLLGESRSGKTVAAAAAFRAELDRGNDRAQWVHASDLDDDDAMARALSSSFCVLDDLGYELDGATGGWLFGKRGPAREFLAKWETRSRARLIITTAFTFDELASEERGYGGAAAQRVYERADTIRVRCG